MSSVVSEPDHWPNDEQNNNPGISDMQLSAQLNDQNVWKQLDSIDHPYSNPPANLAYTQQDPDIYQGEERHYNETEESNDINETDDYELNDDAISIHTNRIVYDDLTAIDWTHEFLKERIRQQELDQIPGLKGKLHWIYDASQVWFILLVTGVMTALVAAYIDIVAKWLGDLRVGYCSTSFYLSRDTCCLGLDPREACSGWKNWSTAFHVSNSVGSYILSFSVYTLYTVLFSAIASMLVLSYAKYARWSGIPEVKTMLGGFVIREFLGSKTMLIKSIGLCLVVGAGLWVGTEGPLVHIACCFANITMKMFETFDNNEAKKREILSAAAAAGISVAFGSPIGGVIFSLEQVSYYFPHKTLWHSFVCAMVAAVTLQLLNPFRTGKLVLFQVKYNRLWHRFELIPFALLGILGGLYGAYLIKLNMRIARWRRTTPRVSNHSVLEVSVVAVITAITNYPGIYSRIQSSELLSYLFQECSSQAPGDLCNPSQWLSTLFLLLLASILGFLLTSYSFGLNIPAGIIMPSMMVGALVGRAFGLVMNTWHENHRQFFLFSACPPDGTCITPGVYALVGAASTLAGATRLTVSAVVIMLELTGALNYVLPIMTGVMVSKWVADSFGRKGIYEAWIQLMEYPLFDNREDEPIPEVSVSTIMTKIDDITVITDATMTLDSLEKLLNTTSFKGFPIIKQDSNLVGYISRQELRAAVDWARNVSESAPSGSTICSFVADLPTVSDNLLDLSQWAELTPMTLSTKSTLQIVTSMFRNLGLRYILLTARGQLKGLLTRKDVWLLLNSLDEAHFMSDSPVRNRMLSAVSYNFRGSEDEMRLLSDDDESNASEGVDEV